MNSLKVFASLGFMGAENIIWGSGERAAEPGVYPSMKSG
jgi:hypothetical protein